MRIKIAPNSVSFEELKMSLVTNFPDLELTERSRNFIVASRGMLVGCNIKLKRRAIIVSGNFPNKKQQIAFAIATVIFGFILPLTAYCLLFHKRFKKFEREITEFVIEEFKN